MIRLGQESGSAAISFRDLANVHRIRLQFSGAQSHTSLALGEKYDELLRRVFKIL